LLQIIAHILVGQLYGWQLQTRFPSLKVS